MEIFNIHLFEFVVIAGLALVVFGPERLPEVGRFMGKQVARVLAWQQQSPEAQMIQEIRQEFEQEIISLRDELVRTRQQLDISGDMRKIESDMRSTLQIKPAANARPIGGAMGAGAAPQEAAGPAANGAAPAEPTLEAPAAPAQPELPAPEPLRPAPPEAPAANGAGPAPAVELPPEPPHRRGLHDPAPRDEEAAPTGPARADEEVAERVGALLADVHALIAELRERGMLSADWQPPSAGREQETIQR